MKLLPVKNYKTPKYPDKKQVLENPSILNANLPKRWKNNFRAITAFTALLAISSAGCETANDISNNTTVEGKLLAAPVFKHSDGRVAYGGVTACPTVYLTEDEAFDVIRSEAEKYGITLEKDGYVLENVKIPLTSHLYMSHISRTKKGSLELDGVDKSLKIGVEFISREDHDAWINKDEVDSLSVLYDVRSTAKTLQQGLDKASDDITVGIFYDPMFVLERKKDDSTPYEERKAIMRENSLDLLRKQVKDFLEWLKGEGII